MSQYFVAGTARFGPGRRGPAWGCDVRAAAVGLSGWVALGLLVPMEAGVPIPLPADLVLSAWASVSLSEHSRCGSP